MTRSLVLIPRDGDRQFLTREQAEELLASVPDYVEPVFDVVVPDADKLIDLLISRGKPFPKSENRMFGDKEYNVGLALSLEAALKHARSNGFVPSMPLIIAGKSKADMGNFLWKNLYDCLSEELVGVDEHGVLAGKGEPLVIVVHGGGVLTGSPDRIMKAYSDEVDGWGKISNAEFAGVLNGELPNGRRLSGVYTVQDVINGKVANPLSSTYAVWLRLEDACSISSNWLEKSDFMNSHLVIARAGTLDYVGSYFDKAVSFYRNKKNKTIGNYHSLAGLTKKVLKAQARGRVLFDNGGYNGLYRIDLNDIGNFVGVALKKRGASQ